MPPFSYSVSIDTLTEILSLPSSVSEEETNDLAEQLIVFAISDPTKYFFSNISHFEAVQNLKTKNERLYKVIKQSLHQSALHSRLYCNCFVSSIVVIVIVLCSH